MGQLGMVSTQHHRAKVSIEEVNGRAEEIFESTTTLRVSQIVFVAFSFGQHNQPVEG